MRRALIVVLGLVVAPISALAQEPAGAEAALTAPAAAEPASADSAPTAPPATPAAAPAAQSPAVPGFLSQLQAANSAAVNCSPPLADALATLAVASSELEQQHLDPFKRSFMSQFEQDPLLLTTLAKQFTADELAALADSCAKPGMRSLVAKVVDSISLPGEDNPFLKDLEAALERIQDMARNALEAASAQ